MVPLALNGLHRRPLSADERFESHRVFPLGAAVLQRPAPTNRLAVAAPRSTTQTAHLSLQVAPRVTHLDQKKLWWNASLLDAEELFYLFIIFSN